MNGAIIIARKLFDSEIWRLKPLAWARIWIYIIGNVQHADYKELKRGEGYFNFNELCRTKAFGVSTTPYVVDHCNRYLRKANMIATRKATWGTWVKVLNYDLYQTLDNYNSDTKSEYNSDTKSDVAAMLRRSRSGNINKNDKNGSKEKEISNTPLVQEVWNHYIQTSGTKELLLPARKDLISHRLAKFTAADLKLAVTNCFANKFYSGDNDKHWRADASYVFRSDEIVDRLLNLKNPEEKKTWRNAPYD